MTIRKQKNNLGLSSRSSKKYASGKNARAICDRSGYEYPMSEMVVEPGTNYLVHHTMSDGMYSLVDHPQNFPVTKIGDVVGLENPRVDRKFENYVHLSDSLNILQLSDGNNDNLEFNN